jgi:glycosyltransferase involved in cell wall biosynthesis
MKIAIISWMFDIEKHAGIGRVGAEILHGLISRNYEVVTMSLNKTNHLDYLKYLMWDIPHNLPEADVYIAQSPMESIFLPKNKTICMVYDLIPLIYPKLAGANMNGNAIKTFLGANMFRIGANQAAKCKRIITISDMVRDDIKKTLKVKDDQVKVLKLGIRPDLEPAQKPDNVFRIGYLGQLDKRKRVNLLIDAFKQSNIPGELVIAGSGPDEIKLKLQANGDSRIKFLGFIPDAKLKDFYNSLDLFCFPTAVEGLGLPIIEAMACKKPVLVPYDSIIPKEVKHYTYVSMTTLTLMFSMLFASWLNTNKWVRGQDKPQKIPIAYRIAKSYTWSGFMDGLEQTIKEVARWDHF